MINIVDIDYSDLTYSMIVPLEAWPSYS